jgi:toxin FitB
MLVDTNVVSELMRARPARPVLEWAERQDGFALSVVSVEEILFGLQARSNARLSAWFERFLERHCQTLDVTVSIARRCARLRAELRSRGKPRTQADLLIAATAHEHGLSLATRNVRDFDGCGIPLVNPFQPGSSHSDA